MITVFGFIRRRQTADRFLKFRVALFVTVGWRRTLKTFPGGGGVVFFCLCRLLFAGLYEYIYIYLWVECDV